MSGTKTRIRCFPLVSFGVTKVLLGITKVVRPTVRPSVRLPDRGCVGYRLNGNCMEVSTMF